MMKIAAARARASRKPRQTAALRGKVGDREKRRGRGGLVLLALAFRHRHRVATGCYTSPLVFIIRRCDTRYVNYHRAHFLSGRVHSIRARCATVLLEPPELYARRQRDQPETKSVVRTYPACIFIRTCVAGTRASSRNLTGAVLLAARFAWEHAWPWRSDI